MSETTRALGKTLITGSNGFIGQHLQACLSANACDHEGLSLRGETVIGEAGALSQKVKNKIASANNIVHLAGLAHADATKAGGQARYDMVNCDLTVAVARAAIEHGLHRFIFVSSVKAAGYDQSKPSNDEVDNAWPDDIYGRSKRNAEEQLLTLDWGETELQILRPCLVYGADVKGNINSVLKLVCRGWFPQIKGAQQRSMLAVENFNAAIMAVLRADRLARQLYIVADERTYSIADIAELAYACLPAKSAPLTLPASLFSMTANILDWFAKILAVDLPWGKARSDKMLGQQIYSAACLKNDTGWRAERTLADSMPAMLDQLAK